jgi:hypothetical protein
MQPRHCGALFPSQQGSSSSNVRVLHTMIDPPTTNRRPLSSLYRAVLGAMLGILAFVIIAAAATALWRPVATDPMTCSQGVCDLDLGQIFLNGTIDVFFLPGILAGLIAIPLTSNTTSQFLLGSLVSSLPLALLGALLASYRKPWSCIVFGLVELWLGGGLGVVLGRVVLLGLRCTFVCAG